jgi:5-formyltetrahydrofolate cyclo-ligase
MNAAAKTALRNEALARRGELSDTQAAAFSKQIAGEALELSLRLRPQGGIAALYWPMRNEADPRPLVIGLRGAGFEIALPVTPETGFPLIFRLWRDSDPLVKGRYGIAEPAEECPLARPDLVFLPLAAFDRTGQRIGYGGGYYDRTLAALRAERAISAIGLAYSVQEVEAIPFERHDEKLDFLLTERELLEFS